ncbi:MAG: 3D domain-containing protein [Phycisphaerales bacterium]|nr:3D domain-containing protein [Planctomycetota bacterium]MCH8507255.1 3D domain-containing protein [Phycisphaerales bacterium]
MNQPKTMTPAPIGRPTASMTWLPVVARTVAGALAIAVVMGSAVMTKRAGTLPALVGLERTAAPASPMVESHANMPMTEIEPEVAAEEESVEIIGFEEVTEDSPEWDLSTRWFDGRPVRPARVLLMRVTAYSPDHRSCGEFADGQTATLHSVWTNGMRLVAADPKLLPYGTMLTVPGYADNEIVPVLDCGGAIKGARLDVLYPTHERALQWGVQDLRVVIWEYADGKPAPNPRRVR